jgi:hypothetical protein
MNGQCYAPLGLAREKNRSLHCSLQSQPGCPGEDRCLLFLSGIELRIGRPSHYTDCTIQRGQFCCVPKQTEYCMTPRLQSAMYCVAHTSNLPLSVTQQDSVWTDTVLTQFTKCWVGGTNARLNQSRWLSASACSVQKRSQSGVNTVAVCVWHKLTSFRRPKTVETPLW